MHVTSEIGELKKVILHRPGREMENMTPANAERALYSDILNLSIALKEYASFEKVLNLFAETFYVKDLLLDIIGDSNVKSELINELCGIEKVPHIKDMLLHAKDADFVKYLIEGLPLVHNSLTNFLNPNTYEINPLHNFYFTRDTSAVIGRIPFISYMANTIRLREAKIVKYIIRYHPVLSGNSASVVQCDQNSIARFEGGDILVLDSNSLIIGMGARTNSQGIDFICNVLAQQTGKYNVIVQELPQHSESFIHLDMVFTLIDKDKCIVYAPLILKRNKYQTIRMLIDDGKVISIDTEENILSALKNIGRDYEPVLCGGQNPQNQEREQWHSGANFFALAPGKIIGYGRNNHTIEELSKKGFAVFSADEIIKDKNAFFNNDNLVITINGAELARGGGGCRCMTLPVERVSVI